MEFDGSRETMKRSWVVSSQCFESKEQALSGAGVWISAGRFAFPLGARAGIFAYFAILLLPLVLLLLLLLPLRLLLLLLLLRLLRRRRRINKDVH